MSSSVTPVKASRQPVVRAWLALLGVAVALHAAHTVLGLGPGGALFDVWLYNAIILAAAGTCVARGVLRRAERRAWLALGAGMVSWSAADVGGLSLRPVARSSRRFRRPRSRTTVQLVGENGRC
ncbi:hypothetical protein BH20ACT18_BH20ACT18_05450 [soil metagenome]